MFSVHGELITDPTLVKKDFFFEFYYAKFQPFNGIKLVSHSSRFSSLGFEATSSLEALFLAQEIKEAV